MVDKVTDRFGRVIPTCVFEINKTNCIIFSAQSVVEAEIRGRKTAAYGLAEGMLLKSLEDALREREKFGLDKGESQFIDSRFRFHLIEPSEASLGGLQMFIESETGFGGRLQVSGGTVDFFRVRLSEKVTDTLNLEFRNFLQRYWLGLDKFEECHVGSRIGCEGLGNIAKPVMPEERQIMIFVGETISGIIGMAEVQLEPELFFVRGKNEATVVSPTRACVISIGSEDVNLMKETLDGLFLHGGEWWCSGHKKVFEDFCIRSRYLCKATFKKNSLHRIMNQILLYPLFNLPAKFQVQKFQKTFFFF